LWRDGQYVSQTYLWRSAPPGADAASLVLGNPFNRLWGGAVRHVYETLGMKPYDGPFWMGVVPIMLLATRASWQRRPDAQQWLLVLAVFCVWAIGPYLLVFGVNTGLPMPQTILRFVPIAANARVPGHAAVLVVLSAAVLLAMAISTWGSRRRGRAWTAAVASLILLDFSPWRIQMAPLDRPPVYERLAALPAGAVLEVPFGIRDGFGEDGVMDVATMYYQTIHGKPLAGGYVSRMPPAVKARYDAMPFDTLLALSAGRLPKEPLPTGEAAASRLAALGIRYVVVNAGTAGRAVRAFVASMPLTLLADDGNRQLYRLNGQ
jgi:hypothetical protein